MPKQRTGIVCQLRTTGDCGLMDKKGVNVIRHNHKNVYPLPESTPCDGLGIVLLRLLAGPNVGPLHRQKDWSLIIDDRVHKNFGAEKQKGGRRK